MAQAKKEFIQDHEANLFRKGDVYQFIIASVKGISQIVLIENVITGLIILAAITVASFFLGMITFLSVVIGTLVAIIGGADQKAIHSGLFGYNSALTGLALALFLTGPYNWIIALIGAGLASIVTASLMHMIKRTTIPILTFPFVIITWFMLLISYKLDAFQLSSSLAPGTLSNWTLVISGDVDVVTGFVLGIAQIFFLDNILSGILLFIALFWAGWRFGIYAIIASAFALLTAFLLGAEHDLISLGLYGYNAILTIIAVSIIFKENENRFAFISGLVGAGLTILITASLSTWLVPYGLPALTMAFVLSSWIFLGARKVMPNL